MPDSEISAKQNTIFKKKRRKEVIGATNHNILVKAAHYNIEVGWLMAIFMLCLSSTPTKMETTSHNWIVLDIVHHNWHIIHSNEYILLRAYMIDRLAVEVTTVNTDHNMFLWMHMQTNI